MDKNKEDLIRTIEKMTDDEVEEMNDFLQLMIMKKAKETEEESTSCDAVNLI